MPNNSNRKKLFVCLPIYRTYEARYRMFCMAADHGWDVTMVLLHGPHPKEQQFENIRQVTVPENKGYFRRGPFWRNLFSHVPRDTPVVIQDTFVADMARSLSGRDFMGRVVRPNIRNVLSFYFPTSGYFLQGHWLLPKEVRLTVKQKIHVLKRYLSVAAIERYSVRLMDALVANAQNILDDACRYYRFPTQKTQMIPAALDDSFFSPGPSRRSKLDLPREGPIVLYVGNRQRHKGIEIALQALGLLQVSYPAAKLVMVGPENNSVEGWYKRFMGDGLARHVIIRDTVTPAELRDYYRSSDVFFLPTRHEGSPRVIKEALACGCPVVTSQISGNYAIDPKGESLVFADNWDPQQYAGLINKVLSDAKFRQERIDAGFEVLKLITVEMTSRKYVELYDSLY